MKAAKSLWMLAAIHKKTKIPSSIRLELGILGLYYSSYLSL